MPEPFQRVESATVVLPMADIDTDQIIPARFLTTTERVGLGAHAFQDARQPGGFASVLADPRCRDAKILVAGDNFGCGSSREHAPWALLDFGFRVVVSTSFADIFRSNALKNGLLPVVAPPELHAKLLLRPWASIAVDLTEMVLTTSEGETCTFTVEPFARLCLLEGMDPLDFLLRHDAEITEFEANHS